MSVANPDWFYMVKAKYAIAFIVTFTIIIAQIAYRVFIYITEVIYQHTPPPKRAGKVTTSAVVRRIFFLIVPHHRTLFCIIFILLIYLINHEHIYIYWDSLSSKYGGSIWSFKKLSGELIFIAPFVLSMVCVYLSSRRVAETLQDFFNDTLTIEESLTKTEQSGKILSVPIVILLGINIIVAILAPYNLGFIWISTIVYMILTPVYFVAYMMVIGIIQYLWFIIKTLAAYILYFFIILSNFIHPSKNALSGAGVLIALLGLVITIYQLLIQ